MRIENRTKYKYKYLSNGTILVTSDPDFKVTPLFDAEYLRNGK